MWEFLIIDTSTYCQVHTFQFMLFWSVLPQSAVSLWWVLLDRNHLHFSIWFVHSRVWWLLHRVHFQCRFRWWDWRFTSFGNFSPLHWLSHMLLSEVQDLPWLDFFGWGIWDRTAWYLVTLLINFNPLSRDSAILKFMKAFVAVSLIV